MRHARSEALDRLEPLLASLRLLPALNERSRGVFYRKTKAFLHFHEDEAGLFADVRLTGDRFHRMRVTSQKERAVFLRTVRAALTG